MEGGGGAAVKVELLLCLLLVKHLKCKRDRSWQGGRGGGQRG